MKKILVVEDNQIVAGVYRAKLQAEGFQVEVAVDGQAGMDMIERTHPDLVLLDLIMPKMTGVEILTRLRAQTAFQTLPVIVFSSSYVSDEAWQAGATQVLNKASHSPKQVVEEVRRALAAIPPIQVAASSPLVAASTASIPLESSPATPPNEDAEFLTGLRKTFFETAPETLAAVRATLQAITNNPRDATNIFDLYRKIHAISGNAGLSGLPGIFRLTAALEALLKEITEKPKQFTPSVLRTLVNAIEYLPQLFAHQTQPVEESELSVYVMIVDDEEIARRAIAFGLEKADFRSLRIAEATTALKVLAENRFDLLLLDVEMPEMNGFELCAKLRALPMHTQTPVVFITTPIEFQRHLTSGATKGNDVIAKPFLYAELAVKALTLLLNRQLKK